MDNSKISSEQALKNLIAMDRDLAIKCADNHAIFNYALKKYIRIVSDIKPQYHYTDINGFMGIMENQELWATNTRFLNDENECIEGLILAEKITKECLEACIEEDKSYYESFQKVIRDRIDNGSNQNFYSISFCEDGDLLSQWRGYGKRGGISIGFDLTYYKTEHDGKCITGVYNFMDRHHYEKASAEKKVADDFSAEDGEFMVKLRKVIYDESEQRSILNDFIDIGISAVRLGNLVRDEEQLVKNILASLDWILPTFKNKGFEEEKEVRYIWKEDGTRKIYFRERNGTIVPYIKCMLRDWKYKKLENFPVKDIVVGPQAKQKEVIDGIKYFLQCNGYEYLVDKVRASKIPYRE